MRGGTGTFVPADERVHAGKMRKLRARHRRRLHQNRSKKNSAWQNNFATSYQRNHLRAKVRCAGKGDMRVSYK